MMQEVSVYRLVYADGTTQDVMATSAGGAVRNRMGPAMPHTVTNLSMCYRGETPKVAVRMYQIPNKPTSVSWCE